MSRLVCGRVYFGIQLVHFRSASKSLTKGLRVVIYSCQSGNFTVVLLYGSFTPIFQAGANMIVSGTAVVKSNNPRETINYLRRAVDEAIQKSNLER